MERKTPEILTGECAICGETYRTDQLKQLPEVENYARKFALFMSGKGEKPVIEESYLLERYGYGLKSLFCDTCYSKLLESVSKGDTPKS